MMLETMENILGILIVVTGPQRICAFPKLLASNHAHRATKHTAAAYRPTTPEVYQSVVQEVVIRKRCARTLPRLLLKDVLVLHRGAQVLVPHTQILRVVTAQYQPV